MTDIQLLDAIVKEIVADQEAVKIERTTDDLGVLLSLQVAPEDMGKLIGRGGNTAKGIRTVLRAAGMKAGARVNVKILEPDGSELGYGTQATQ